MKKSILMLVALFVFVSCSAIDGILGSEFDTDSEVAVVVVDPTDAFVGVVGGTTVEGDIVEGYDGDGTLSFEFGDDGTEVAALVTTVIANTNGNNTSHVARVPYTLDESSVVYSDDGATYTANYYGGDGQYYLVVTVDAILGKVTKIVYVKKY